MIALVEVRDWLAIRGLPEDDAQAGNKGGTLEAAGVKVTLVDARHSSSIFHDGASWPSARRRAS